MKLNDFLARFGYSTIRLGDGRVLIAGDYTLQKAGGVRETTLFGRFLPDGSRDRHSNSSPASRLASVGPSALSPSRIPDHYLLWGRTNNFGPFALFTYSAQGNRRQDRHLKGAPLLWVNQLTGQPDGRILIAGSFERIGRCRRISARPAPGSSVDPAFDTGGVLMACVTAVVELADEIEFSSPAPSPTGMGNRTGDSVLLQPNGSWILGSTRAPVPTTSSTNWSEQPDGRSAGGRTVRQHRRPWFPRLARLQIPASTPPLPARLTVQPITTVSPTNSTAPDVAGGWSWDASAAMAMYRMIPGVRWMAFLERRPGAGDPGR